MKISIAFGGIHDLFKSGEIIQRRLTGIFIPQVLSETLAKVFRYINRSNEVAFNE